MTPTADILNSQQFNDSAYDLVIFDFDGTLVDSEPIADRVWAEVAANILKIDLSIDDARVRYRGHTVQYVYADLAKRYGKPLPVDFEPQVKVRYYDTIERELRATPGAISAIEALSNFDMCIVSNSDTKTIRHCLRLVGMENLLGEHIFSGPELHMPKPDPEIFLHAAKLMDVKPERCIVLEDSYTGASGALAAGMKVVGYVGTHPEVEGIFRSLGLDIINHVADFPQIVLR